MSCTGGELRDIDLGGGHFRRIWFVGWLLSVWLPPCMFGLCDIPIDIANIISKNSARESQTIDIEHIASE
jgi:hypothetical protein